MTGRQPHRAAGLDLLAALQAAHVFDAAPLRAAMHELHVPFDELCGRRICERPLLAAVRGGHRVALVGVSGSGKTSVTEAVLGPLVEGLAPIAVPVSIEAPAVATDPGAFTQHVVSVVRRWVTEGLPSAAGRAGQVGYRRPPAAAHKFSVAPTWLGAKVELGYELRQATEDRPVTGAERLDQARQLLDILRHHDLSPVLVLDDTDRWLSSAWQPDSLAVRAAFFGRVVRLLAEDLATAAVVAVHPAYLGAADYQVAAGFLDTTVRVPALPSVAAMARVLARRVALALAAAGLPTAEEQALDGVVAPDALQVLFEHYLAGAPDLRRRVLQVAHLALTLAVDDGADVLATRHVLGAVAETSAPG